MVFQVFREKAVRFEVCLKPYSRFFGNKCGLLLKCVSNLTYSVRWQASGLLTCRLIEVVIIWKLPSYLSSFEVPLFLKRTLFFGTFRITRSTRIHLIMVRPIIGTLLEWIIQEVAEPWQKNEPIEDLHNHFDDTRLARHSLSFRA